MKKNQKNIKEFRLKKNAEIIEYSPTQEFLNEEFLGRAIAECLREDDYKMIYDIVRTYKRLKEKVYQNEPYTTQ